MQEKDLIKNLSDLKNIKPRADWKSSQRNILLKQISGSREGATPSLFPAEFLIPPFKWLRYLTQPAMAVILIVGVIAGSGAMSVFASKNSIPGDSLYIAKIINEKTQFALTFDEEKKARLGLEFAGKRAKELQEVMQAQDGRKDKSEQVEKLVNDFRKEVNSARERITRINAVDPVSAPIAEQEEPAVPVFSANLSKDEQGIEISDPVPAEPITAETAETADLPKADSPQTADGVLIQEAPATTTKAVSPDPGQAILEAQTLLIQQDFDGTLSKLEEADSLIGQVGQGEVKGTSTSAVIEDDGEVLGAEEGAASSTED